MHKVLEKLIKYKIIFIISFCFILVLTFLGMKFLTKSTPKELEDNSIKSIELDNIVIDELKIEINSKEPKPEDFFEKTNENELTLSYYQNEEKVNLNLGVLGTYDVFIEGNNNYRSKLTVVDTTPPEVELKNISIYENGKYLIEDFISSYKDNSNSKEYTINYVDEAQSKLTNQGTYDITLRICDVNNVCTEKTTILKINKKNSATETTSNQSSDSNKQSTTTSKEEVKKVKKTTEKVIIKSTDIKYGVKEVTTANITYDIYSDGTKKEIKRTDIRTKYDFSGFNGTINTMKPEATNLYNSLSNTRTTILNETNKYRSEKNIPDLTLDKNLSILATIRAMEMAYGDKFSHTRPNGEEWSTFWGESGFNFTVPPGGYYGENLAYGYDTDLGACNGWRNSEGHYENMIKSEFTKIGIGKYTFNGKTYWVQFFSS